MCQKLKKINEVSICLQLILKLITKSLFSTATYDNSGARIGILVSLYLALRQTLLLLSSDNHILNFSKMYEQFFFIWNTFSLMYVIATKGYKLTKYADVRDKICIAISVARKKVSRWYGEELFMSFALCAFLLQLAMTNVEDNSSRLDTVQDFRPRYVWILNGYQALILPFCIMRTNLGSRSRRG